MTRDNDSSRTLVAQNDWRGWISARTQELKRDNFSRSKKECWRAAQDEWNELRRQHKREQKEEQRSQLCGP
jgi:hypothetical protein